MPSSHDDTIALAERHDLAADGRQVLTGSIEHDAPTRPARSGARVLLEHDESGGSGCVAFRNALRESQNHQAQSEEMALDPELHLGQPLLYRPLPHDFFSFQPIFGPGAIARASE